MDTSDRRHHAYCHTPTAILLLDIFFSLILAWLSDGQAGPLTPFALGVLILPGMIYHWRGTLAGSPLTYIALDSHRWLGLSRA